MPESPYELSTADELPPEPNVDDHDLRPFWEGTQLHQLRIQRCVACEEPHWPARVACARCGDLRLTWFEVEPAGSLFSWTTVWRTALPYFRQHVPYTVGIIELDQVGVRMIGHVTVPDAVTLMMGMRLECYFVAYPGGALVPYWRPAEVGVPV